MFGAIRIGRRKKSEEQKEPQMTIDTSTFMASARVAAWSARNRWLVVLASVLVLVAAVFVSSTFETKIYDGDGEEGESAVAVNLVEERFGDLTADGRSRPTEQLVVSNPSLDAKHPTYRATVEELVGRLNALREVESVSSYYDAQDENLISEDGHVILARILFSDIDVSEQDQVVPIFDTVVEANAANEEFEIGLAGDISIQKQLEDLAEEDFSRILLVTMVLGLTILLIAFRSAIAAIVPLILALGSIFVATAIAGAVSQVYALADGYGEMILLMGMAVGIDYSLFIISRYRNERKAGRSKLDAIAFASNTTGRAVFYAGITVMLSLGGLALTNNPIFTSLGLAAIIVVLVAIVASQTLLPAFLAILGDNINRLRVPFIGYDKNASEEGGIWGTITDKVLAKPAVLATIAAGALIAVAIPATSLNLGFNSGADAIPNAVEGKRAVELLEEHFTSGLTAPAFVGVDAKDVRSAEVQASVARLIEIAERDESFFPPFEVEIAPMDDFLFVRIPLVGNIDDEASEEAVQHLRNDVVPVAFGELDADVYVAGKTASSMDFKNHMYKTAPYVFGFVLGLAFLLMLVMFRSIVIPVKAIILNLLSVGAAYGVLVVVFQFGWGISLLGAEATGVVEAWLPLFLFGLLFGLSMDYHMLILNRIKEAHDQGMSNEDAVSHGIKITAGQITSAAAIMVGVFGTFALATDIAMKQFGLGLGVAVLIDATVIRSVLLPESMKLLGNANWYLPNWLNWLPNFDTEGEAVVRPRTQVVEYGMDD